MKNPIEQFEDIVNEDLVPALLENKDSISYWYKILYQLAYLSRMELMVFYNED